MVGDDTLKWEVKKRVDPEVGRRGEIMGLKHIELKWELMRHQAEQLSGSQNYQESGVK